VYCYIRADNNDLRARCSLLAPCEIDPKTFKLLTAIGGLFVFFLLYGVVQEKIMTKPYGKNENGDDVFFKVSAFLVLNNRVVTMVMAIVLAVWNGESTMPVAPLYTYFGCASREANIFICA
jgi:hypothetical protein